MKQSIDHTTQVTLAQLREGEEMIKREEKKFWFTKLIRFYYSEIRTMLRIDIN